MINSNRGGGTSSPDKESSLWFPIEEHACICPCGIGLEPVLLLPEINCPWRTSGLTVTHVVAQLLTPSTQEKKKRGNPWVSPLLTCGIFWDVGIFGIINIGIITWIFEIVVSLVDWEGAWDWWVRTRAVSGRRIGMWGSQLIDFCSAPLNSVSAEGTSNSPQH